MTWLARLILKMGGWKDTIGAPPKDIKKAVIIAAPHTSNWDFVYMICFAKVFGLKLNWMGKHTLFSPPLGWLMRLLGGVPIDRRKPGGMVAQMAEQFQNREVFMLAIPPEGTRKYVDKWKSGFYVIAKEANVPILPSVLDFGTREGGFAPPLYPSDDVKADMDVLREVYKGRVGLYPEKTGKVYISIEDKQD